MNNPVSKQEECKCCELNHDFVRGVKWVRLCVDCFTKNCTKPESWEDRFDKALLNPDKFSSKDQFKPELRGKLYEAFKDFIRQELQLARSEERRRCTDLVYGFFNKVLASKTSVNGYVEFDSHTINLEGNKLLSDLKGDAE